jgi:hypothetical protein
MKTFVRCAALCVALFTSSAAVRAADCPAGNTACAATASFTAQVVDWRTVQSNGTHYVSGTVRFSNRTAHVLVLGHPRGGSSVSDDRGNLYAVGKVVGIGEIGGGGVDTKFSLQPGESAEARFDFRGPGGGTLVGTRFTMTQTVRELEPLPSGQWQLGREHALRYQGLVNGLAAGAAEAPPAAGAAPGPAPTATSPAAPVPLVADACGGQPHCSSAGAVAVQVAGLTSTSSNNRNLLKLDLKFSNRGSVPVILAYRAGSHQVVDNQGGAYGSGQLGQPVAGIGQVRSGVADPQFLLQPGETRMASFNALGYGRRTGTSYTHSLALEQLEILPSQQVRTVREYALSFADLTPGGAAAANLKDTAQKIKNLFKQ